MDLRDFKTYDVEALGYKCTVIGCRRSDREPGAGIAHSLDHGAGGALPFSAITVFLLTIAAARAAQ